MTEKQLRRHFAGLALQAIISKIPPLKYKDIYGSVPEMRLVTELEGKEIRAAAAKLAFDYADEMMVHCKNVD